MTIKTVGDLIEKLKEFDPNCTLDVDVSWYDRDNYNHAHRDIWGCPNGIEVYVCENDGIVIIMNEYSEDMRVYE